MYGLQLRDTFGFIPVGTFSTLPLSSQRIPIIIIIIIVIIFKLADDDHPLQRN